MQARAVKSCLNNTELIRNYEKGECNVPFIPLFGSTVATLEKSLNLRSKQHQILSSNIANMDTPNYKAFELVIEEEMTRTNKPSKRLPLQRTHGDHLASNNYLCDSVELKYADPPEFSLRGDGNTVDVEKTMGKLAENTILYKTAAQLISAKFKGLKTAIQGGK